MGRGIGRGSTKGYGIIKVFGGIMLDMGDASELNKGLGGYKLLNIDKAGGKGNGKAGLLKNDGSPAVVKGFGGGYNGGIGVFCDKIVLLGLILWELQLSVEIASSKHFTSFSLIRDDGKLCL
jgi:hypothetical protein